MLRSLKQFSFIGILSLLVGSCAPQVSVTQTPPVSPTNIAATSSASQPAVTETLPVIEPTRPAITINPLTGLEVQDPSLLNLPTALVSIANFPALARPQSGLSFAPYVFEIYITAGGTRFLATFYGEFPEPEAPVVGNCTVRKEPFVQTENILGNRIWLDANQNQMQDAWERGVGGVCVNLYDANNNLLQQTTTDSNGYYGFNVSAGKYVIEAVKPEGLEFDQKDVGDETQDSDVDQATGRSDAVDITSTLLDLDVGLIQLNEPLPTSNLAPPYVGPVRSGRLVYADIANFFQGSCLIFAYASSEVLVELPQCAFVDHILQGGGYMLEVDKMKELANERMDVLTPERYVSNIFSAIPPEGGAPASRLHVNFAWLNQSGWAYDAASQTWWRYVDDSTVENVGILHPEVDRLNKRQLQFENVIVLFAVHDVISPTNLDIHLEQDWVGDALLFRDGQRYKIRWSTRATEAEVNSGIRKPIQFYYPDDTALFPLKPGRTWVTVVTPLTTVTETSAGEWYLQFSQPPGAK
jgi:hypothetical protein